MKAATALNGVHRLKLAFVRLPAVEAGPGQDPSGQQEFAIASGLPIPETRQGAPCKYPWDKLAVGDSFFIPGKTSQTISPARQSAEHTRGTKYASRTVEENGVRGVRVWRIK